MLALEDRHAHVFASSQFPAAELSVPKARRFVKSAYECFKVPTDTVELIVSELVTNGVQHTQRPVRVTLFTPSSGLLRIEVADTSSAPPRRRQASPDDESGRGMELTEALSESFEVALIPGGKVVCVSIAVEEAFPT
ncbi:anti-sigma regulatory factor (Ser/Thr protein kinase) [Streptacidiphilus sp. BW17]|uniref:ATP-binding protein n=1 Tax=unclassified Streptacidiphilus TaxID=2643834 RepID=UPI0035171223